MLPSLTAHLYLFHDVVSGDDQLPQLYQVQVVLNSPVSEGSPVGIAVGTKCEHRGGYMQTYGINNDHPFGPFDDLIPSM